MSDTSVEDQAALAIVFEENKYRAKVNTWEGAGYLLPQYICKCVNI